MWPTIELACVATRAYVIQDCEVKRQVCFIHIHTRVHICTYITKKAIPSNHPYLSVGGDLHAGEREDTLVVLRIGFGTALVT